MQSDGTLHSSCGAWAAVGLVSRPTVQGGEERNEDEVFRWSHAPPPIPS